MNERVTCGSLTGTECDGCEVFEGHGYYWMNIDMEEGTPDYCSRCGARLSFDTEGNPTAEVMVLASEVERLARVLGHAGELAAEEAEARYPFAYAEAFKVTARHLAAAEEASDGTGSAGR